MARKPISKVKYVKDVADLGSKTAAVRKQRPDLSDGSVYSQVQRLEKDEIVQQLREQLDGQMLDLNYKRIQKLHDLLDSDQEKIALGAVKEAGSVVEQYRDRNEGKAKQQVEVHSSHVAISLDFSGKSATNITGDGFDLIEGEVDG